MSTPLPTGRRCSTDHTIIEKLYKKVNEGAGFPENYFSNCTNKTDINIRFS